MPNKMEKWGWGARLFGGGQIFCPLPFPAMPRISRRMIDGTQPSLTSTNYAARSYYIEKETIYSKNKEAFTSSLKEGDVCTAVL